MVDGRYHGMTLASRRKFSDQLLRGVKREPDDTGDSLGNLSISIGARHICLDPTRAKQIDGNRAHQFRGENSSHCIERCLGNAIRRITALHVRKRAHAARNIYDSSPSASPAYRSYFLRQVQGSQGVYCQSLPHRREIARSTSSADACSWK